MLFPLPAPAHPGKTDVRDGHKCWKNCDEWGLERGEYHLHDKNWNPIRLNKDSNPVGLHAVEMQPQATGPSETIKLQNPQVQAHVEKALSEPPAVNTPSQETDLPFNFLALAFILLCLLAILALIHRKRKDERQNAR